jgi:hypothetical protein
MVGEHVGDHLAHRADLGQRVDVGTVDNMHQQVSADDLF